jgi:hypothetical protein
MCKPLDVCELVVVVLNRPTHCAMIWLTWHAWDWLWQNRGQCTKKWEKKKSSHNFCILLHVFLSMASTTTIFLTGHDWHWFAIRVPGTYSTCQFSQCFFYWISLLARPATTWLILISVQCQVVHSIITLVFIHFGAHKIQDHPRLFKAKIS